MKNVRIYTTPFCPFCIFARKLLDELKVEYEDYDVSVDLELRSRISRDNGGWRTVPMIFIKDQFIGGFSELNQLHEKGELMDKINA